ncbi:hypothetical protein BS78_10G262100 [Paspalum vaginatum]|nr:hypothetical protein BS78_10G262100 [Paspalum vaginatum]
MTRMRRALLLVLVMLAPAVFAGGAPTTTPEESNVASIISRSLFEQLLLHRDDPLCQARGFYTYGAFIAAANAFPGFGTTGDVDTRKRELAAFLAQTSHETTGGWETAPDGPFAWGYCFKEEVNGTEYCDPISANQWPCAAGEKYYGRGPFQITWNYNYGQAGADLGLDLLADPDLVASDAVVSFETAIWYWMTPTSDKPSCHDGMTGLWTPSADDLAAGRLPGYGITTNIINGENECGRVFNTTRTPDRIGFYQRYCDMLGVGYGDNMYCTYQRPFGTTTFALASA